MKKFLFATHGTLAAGAKSTLELLVGNVADITCLTAYVNPDDNVDEQLKAYFSEISDEDQVIVCTDLMGGSVNQKIVPYAQKKNVFLIAGFNLPLLLELAMNEDKVTEEELLDSIEEARKNMMLVRKGTGEDPRLNEKDKVPYLEFEALKKPSWMTHAFSTRLGGVSSG